MKRRAIADIPQRLGKLGVIRYQRQPSREKLQLIEIAAASPRGDRHRGIEK